MGQPDHNILCFGVDSRPSWAYRFLVALRVETPTRSVARVMPARRRSWPRRPARQLRHGFMSQLSRRAETAARSAAPSRPPPGGPRTEPTARLPGVGTRTRSAGMARIAGDAVPVMENATEGVA